MLEIDANEVNVLPRSGKRGPFDLGLLFFYLEVIVAAGNRLGCKRLRLLFGEQLFGLDLKRLTFLGVFALFDIEAELMRTPPPIEDMHLI
ncbi:MAG: hypothetical protein Q7S17_06825 [Xanthobacteraceae bacterium]|nr:hypothetical protein [Xanthobacteraceae bacterium]